MEESRLLRDAGMQGEPHGEIPPTAVFQSSSGSQRETMKPGTEPGFFYYDAPEWLSGVLNRLVPANRGIDCERAFPFSSCTLEPSSVWTKQRKRIQRKNPDSGFLSGERSEIDGNQVGDSRRRSRRCYGGVRSANMSIFVFTRPWTAPLRLQGLGPPIGYSGIVPSSLSLFGTSKMSPISQSRKALAA